MALPVLPSASNFLAVALVINRSKTGPAFVFHYPPNVKPAQGPVCMAANPSSSVGDSARLRDGLDALEDMSNLPGSRVTENRSPLAQDQQDRNPPQAWQWDQDDHRVTESGTHIVPWEHVAGFPTKDLMNILTPARAYHKRQFQLSLDPLVCVSYPIHVPTNGRWHKHRRQKQRGRRRGARAKHSAQPARRPNEDDTSTDDEGEPDGLEGGVEDDAYGDDTDSVIKIGDGNGDENGSDWRDAATQPVAPDSPVTSNLLRDLQDETEDKKSSMTMFNLVFILNPSLHESKDLVDIMFEHIIKKINKLYRYCQQRSDFVWKESKRILTLKEKGREDTTPMRVLWNEILSASSLAASMQDLYEAVSQNKIAVLQLDTAEGMVTHSVQIPMPFHIADLPTEEEEAEGARGLWLTTANSSFYYGDSDGADPRGEGGNGGGGMGAHSGDDDFPGPSGYDAWDPRQISRNFALLLLDEEKKIVAELQAEGNETTMAMVEFVKHCKPTLTFHQVAQQYSNVLTADQVRKFARHFIYWRRAMAIPPLYSRDTYIVSPNCDNMRLASASLRWSRAFPLSPPLPDFLALLGQAPRPYKAQCPSKAHRPVYMSMLAWLMRTGWVTQLCTFAYVVVWPEIVYEVDYAIEADEIAKDNAAAGLLCLGDERYGDGGSNRRNKQNQEGGGESLRESRADISLVTNSPGGMKATSKDGEQRSPHQAGSMYGSTPTLRERGRSPSYVDSPSRPVFSPYLPQSQQQQQQQRPGSRTSSRQVVSSPSTPTAWRKTDSGGGMLEIQNTPISGSISSLLDQTLSQHPQATSPTSPHESRQQEKTQAEKTAEKALLERLQDRAERALAERALVHARRTSPKSTAHPSTNAAPHLASVQPYVILDAGKATGRESLYLTAIGKRLRGGDGLSSSPSFTGLATAGGDGGGGGRKISGGRGRERARDQSKYRGGSSAGRRGVRSRDGAKSKERSSVGGVGGADDYGWHTRAGRGGGGDRLGQGGRSGKWPRAATAQTREEHWNNRVADAWPTFCKHFDGRSALERIALQEDRGPKETWNILLAMSEYLVSVRHW